MANHERDEELNVIKNKLEYFKNDWLQSLEELTTVKEELKNGDLFDTIDYLMLSDQINNTINLDVEELDSHMEFLYEYKTDETEHLINEIEELKDDMQTKLAFVNEEYPSLADRTLRGAQDLITKYGELIHQEKTTPNLRTDINQNLDKESLLEELRDTLETYRQSREELVEDTLHDPIIAELENAITACNSALSIKEITD